MSLYNPSYNHIDISNNLLLDYLIKITWWLYDNKRRYKKRIDRYNIKRG